MNNQVHRKPDFIIIGSMKSGTTSLYSDLSTHPQLYLPSDKEPHILTSSNKIGSIKNAYYKHFSKAAIHQLCGEASTSYTYLPMYDGVADKAYDLCGKNLKLIMIMRDPIERIYSHLRHDLAGQHIKVSEVNEVVLSDEKYIAVSDYARQLKPWINKFGVENVLCISFNEYKKDKSTVLKEVASFLDIEPNKYSVSVKAIKNKSTDLRLTNNYVNLLARSSIYRDIFRPLLSQASRKKLKKILSRKAIVPDFMLSNCAIDTINSRLVSVETDIESLIGKKIDIFAK